MWTSKVEKNRLCWLSIRNADGQQTDDAAGSWCNNGGSGDKQSVTYDSLQDNGGVLVGARMHGCLVSTCVINHACMCLLSFYLNAGIANSLACDIHTCC
jgi:hypothetical protein